jgi:hypothetical protein
VRNKQFIRLLHGLSVAGLVGVGCRDSVAPARRGSSPSESGVAVQQGIALDQKNGSFGPGPATSLRKGFNPTNPHVGDAIIASFFWVNPTTTTNVITGVHDELANGKSVGNPYTLVDFVTADGISMATYIATNVQNFPDPNTAPDQSDILVVVADLSVPVQDGGTLFSAYSGVNPLTAQALGAHQFASGSGSAPTTASPGALAVGTGALAYGVTLANAVVGIDQPPPPFTSLLTQSNTVIKADGEFAVLASAGTLNPQWTWHFEQTPGTSTWLASGLVLNPAPPPPPPTGNLTVSNTTTGANFPASYTITVDAGTASATSQPMAPNGSVTFTNLSAGNHNVELSGVAANCAVSGGNVRTVTVPSGGTATASFTLSCSAPATGKMTGGGKLGSQRDFATFGFEATPAGGKLEWLQHCLNGVNPGSSTCPFGTFTFKGTTTPGSYSAVSGSPACRTWSGTGTLKANNAPAASGPSAFSVNAACDGGNPGRGNDLIDINIAGYHNAGFLSGGNIHLRKSD